jgi:glycosyltransferase involved in cell wall biosynthesis
MSAKASPLVSIGVPTHDAADYVAESLRSLIDLEYSNLEIIVSDNASTDGTYEIVCDLAAGDKRLRVTRSEIDRGATANFNHLLRVARGEYFMWAADHDLWHPRYVATAVDALEEDGGAVLAYAHTRLIDGDGSDLGIMEDEFHLHQTTPFGRYVSLIWRPAMCNAIYGVIRREALLRTGGFRPSLGSDHLMLARLALQGRFIQADDVMYFRRRNRPAETPAEMRERQLVYLNPDAASEWASMEFGDYYRGLRDDHIRAVLLSEMTAVQKVRALTSTLACFQVRYGVESFMYKTVRSIARVLPAGLRRRALGRT